MAQVGIGLLFCAFSAWSWDGFILLVILGRFLLQNKVIRVLLFLNDYSAVGKLNAVPLPPSVWFLGMGIAGLLGIGRKKIRR
ncbi:MAG: hypothetical protein KKA54_16605 [Proteobacteria bacterium]|nr:hypothetical protein [Pseudomonadota bacterium]MBU0967987.1 hypothetical protein [Pseudomonadota bacterium]